MRIIVPPTSIVLETAVAVIDGYHDVPGGDVVTNAHMRDVVGNKTDTATTVVTGVQSLMGLMKGAATHLSAPPAGTTGATFTRETAGNKGDNAQTIITGTRSIMAYVKGILNQIASHITALATHDTALGVVNTLVTALQADLDNGTDGLGALKALLDLHPSVQVPAAAHVITTSSTLSDVLNISDIGVLTGILMVSAGADRGVLKVTIDGVVILDEVPFVNDAVNEVGGSASLSFSHSFGTSLRVEHRNSGNAVTLKTTVAYTTD